MGILHITNGSNLTERLQDLNLDGEMLTWREMLCEGPTSFHINSDEFIEKRTAFLRSQYDISKERYIDKFVNELNRFEDVSAFDTVVLWFEYDLFCHVNMLAAIGWLLQCDYDGKFALVCSGRVKGEDSLKGLSELTKGQLTEHYEERIPLKKSDIELAHSLWKVYNSELPRQFKKYIKQPSSFPYLSNCLSAHLKRFPSSHNGLNLLETHTLNLISQNNVRSLNQLVGYILQYQGYYGYGDLQITRLIKRLRPFIEEKDNELSLTSKGRTALDKEANFYEDMKDTTVYFGGAKKYDYQYNITDRELIHL